MDNISSEVEDNKSIDFSFFFSIDIKNFTSFKQIYKTTWVNLWMNLMGIERAEKKFITENFSLESLFRRDISFELESKGIISDIYSIEQVIKLSVFKRLGDEIIFRIQFVSKELDDEIRRKTLKIIVKIFCELVEYCSLKDKKRHKLSYKGCIWSLKSIDISDWDAIQKEMISEKTVNIDLEDGDCVGSGVDYGFRLHSQAIDNGVVIDKQLVKYLLNGTEDISGLIEGVDFLVKSYECFKGFSRYQPIILSLLKGTQQKEIDDHIQKLSRDGTDKNDFARVSYAVNSYEQPYAY